MLRPAILWRRMMVLSLVFFCISAQIKYVPPSTVVCHTSSITVIIARCWIVMASSKHDIFLPFPSTASSMSSMTNSKSLLKICSFDSFRFSVFVCNASEALSSTSMEHAKHHRSPTTRIVQSAQSACPHSSQNTRSHTRTPGKVVRNPQTLQIWFRSDQHLRHPVSRRSISCNIIHFLCLHTMPATHHMSDISSAWSSWWTTRRLQSSALTLLSQETNARWHCLAIPVPSCRICERSGPELKRFFQLTTKAILSSKWQSKPTFSRIYESVMWYAHVYVYKAPTRNIMRTRLVAWREISACVDINLCLGRNTATWNMKKKTMSSTRSSKTTVIELWLYICGWVRRQDTVSRS